MLQYWVVGGEYKDRHFSQPASGQEEWVGPFTTYEAAKTEWAKRTWATVDAAQIRYRIEKIDPDAPPAHTD